MDPLSDFSEAKIPIPSNPQTTVLQVKEIFFSIQGESTFSGKPCVFVRLAGCPLRCTWCDTEYAFYGGTEMHLEEVLAQVRSYGCPLVEVTGGEPLHQQAAFPFIEALCQEKLEVLIETSGAIDISAVDSRARIILDIKCPGSKMEDRMYWENLHHIKEKDEIKFVINDRQDYDWAVEVVKRYRLTEQCPVLFSPVFEGLELRTMAEWILKDRLPIRFQVQLHKFIWNPEARGV